MRAIVQEPQSFTSLPTGWRCVCAIWFDDGAKPFHITELPAVGVAVVCERETKDADDRGLVVGRHFDFVVVSGEGLELWEHFLGGVNTTEIGFLEPNQKLEEVYKRELIDKAVEDARTKLEKYRERHGLM